MTSRSLEAGLQPQPCSRDHGSESNPPRRPRLPFGQCSVVDVQPQCKGSQCLEKIHLALVSLPLSRDFLPIVTRGVSSVPHSLALLPHLTPLAQCSPRYSSGLLLSLLAGLLSRIDCKLPEGRGCVCPGHSCSPRP